MSNFDEYWDNQGWEDNDWGAKALAKESFKAGRESVLKQWPSDEDYLEYCMGEDRMNPSLTNRNLFLKFNNWIKRRMGDNE